MNNGTKLAKLFGFVPRKVLVVQKRTRLVREELRHPYFSDNLQASGRAGDYHAIKNRHDIHESNLQRIMSELKSHFNEIALVDTITKELIEWADIFISAGGDGTFLHIASHIDGLKPLIGFNTDPERSHGYLCAKGRGENQQLDHIIHQFASGNFSFVKRSRIRVSITHPGVNELNAIEIPRFALNEVYLGDVSPTRLSYMEVSVDGQPAEKQKSSGMIICTGSGSTAWGYHINCLDEYRTKQFLTLLKDKGVNLTDGEEAAIMNDFNNGFIFDCSDMRMKFITREVLQNNVFKASNTQGFAETLRVRSLCWDGKIVMDGVRKFAFDDGLVANFSINKKDALSTVHYVDN